MHNTTPLTREAVCAVIVPALVAHGWTAIDGGTAVARKVYPTAVGPKEALAFVTRSADGDPNRTLSGQYWSEGNNVIRSVLLPKSATEEALRALGAEFASQADQSVGQSYAARLLGR
jgi:hypothetical protein